MEIESTAPETQESTEVSAPAEASAPESLTTIDDLVAKANATPEAPVVPQYQPNYKYKVLDKEHEFDPELQGVIKSKEHEDKIRDLYTKAAGLESIKADRDKFRTDYTTTKEQFETTMKGIQTLNHFYEKGDMANFFEALKIPKEKIFAYALEQLDAKDLPPQQQQYYNKATQLERDNYFMQQQLQQVAEQQAQYQQQQVEYQRAQARAQYEQILTKPEVNAFVSEFEKRNGQGTFDQEIMMRGQAFKQLNGVDPTPEQLVGDLLNRYGFLPQQAQSLTTQPQAVTNSPRHTPVIPIAKGGGTSTVRKKVSSVEDIEKAYQEYASSTN